MQDDRWRGPAHPGPAAVEPQHSTTTRKTMQKDIRFQDRFKTTPRLNKNTPTTPSCGLLPLHLAGFEVGSDRHMGTKCPPLPLTAAVMG